MNNRFKTSFIFIILSFLNIGCKVEKPISKTQPINNKTYDVEYLFEHDGCKVYRFKDGFNTVYFTNCRGETISKRDSIEIRNSTNTNKKD